MLRVLVSACLLGQKVRYNGDDAASASPILDRWVAQGRVVPFCPEVAGGLGVPRPSAEIVGCGGGAVLDGTARVVTAAGTDVTRAFLIGARRALAQGRADNVCLAILKDGSPSCGSTSIYDGRFAGTRRPGVGVTAALFEREGIRVFSEEQFGEAAAFLDELERSLPR
jgi:uncharacterized protein YbbK (DUF523 family)